jgi:hypothetical protein
MEFLLQKDRKEKKEIPPPHIQEHLAAQTHGRPFRSQKSLHFANTPKPTNHPTY